MNLLDQNRIRRDNGEVFEEPYSQAVRLANELRAVPAHTIITDMGTRLDIPAKWGFDCETAPYSDFTIWFNSKIKKSQSLFWFVIRVMAMRFPNKHTEIKNNLNPKHRVEFEFILSEMSNEVEFLGKVGFFNQVMLSDIDKTRNIIKQKDGTFKIKYK